jgi:hypothetical protein
MKNVLVISGKEEGAIAPNWSAYSETELLLSVAGLDV